MNKNYFCSPICALILFGSFSGAVQSAPLLFNGSLTGTTGSSSMAPDWQMIKEAPDLVNAKGPYNNTTLDWVLSPDGGTFVRANGTGESNQEGLQQTISGFTAGATYQLNFYQTNLGFLTPGDEWRNQAGYWGLFVDGDLVSQSATVSGPNRATDAIEWSQQSLQFTATDSSLTLGLEAFTTQPRTSTSAPLSIAYLGIDGLELVSVPLPGALLFMLSGLLGLVGTICKQTFRKADVGTA